jgi:hypothetical protein
MRTRSLKAPDMSQAELPPAPASFGDERTNDSAVSTPTATGSDADRADDDSILIALGQQFEDIAAQLYDPHGAASGETLAQVEALLGRLDPIERAIMMTPAFSIVGLGVKARHVARVVSEYWDAPVDEIDWDARAVRLLVEAVCDLARVPVPGKTK